MQKFLKDKNNLIMLGILAFALFLRLLGLGKGLGEDELFTFSLIDGSFLKAIQNIRSDTHPPLYYILLKIWSYISLDENWLRLLSVIFGMGTIVFSMKWLKRYSLLASNLAGICLSTLPIMLRYSQELRGYALLLFATALSFYFASRVISDPKTKLWYYAVSLSMSIAIASHFVGAMLVIPVYAYILMSIEDKKSIDYKTAMIALLLPLATFIFSSFLIFGEMARRYHNWWVPRPDIKWILFTARYMSGASSAMIFFRLFMQNKLFVPVIYLDGLLLGVMALLGVVILVLGRWRSTWQLFCVALLYWLEMIIFSLFFVPVFIYRTALPGLLPLIGFAALQMATIQNNKIKVSVITLFILLCFFFSANWILFEAWRPIENLRGLFKTVETKWNKNSRLIFYSNWFEDSINYYFQGLHRDKLIALASEAIEEFDDKICIASDKQYPSKLFIVFSCSINKEDFLISCCQLVSTVKGKIKQPLTVEVFHVVRDDVCISDRVLKNYSKLQACLQEEFGKPIVAKDYQGFIYSRYEVSGNE